MKTRNLTGMIIGVVTVLFTGIAHAIPFSFTGITNNNAADTSMGEAQFWVDVTDATLDGGARVLFTFYNDGPASSSIAGIYFDDGHLLGISSIVGSSGVGFTRDATPGNLPGGNGIGFHTSAGFSAGSVQPRPHNGVNPGEWVGIYFDIINGYSFQNVVEDLESGTLLRVGIHAIGFASGGSESFLNNLDPTTASVDAPVAPPVPEPATVFLFGSGLLGLAALRKRFGRPIP